MKNENKNQFLFEIVLQEIAFCFDRNQKANCQKLEVRKLICFVYLQILAFIKHIIAELNFS